MDNPGQWFGPPTTAEALPLVVSAQLDAVEGSVARLGDLPRARLAADRA